MDNTNLSVNYPERYHPSVEAPRQSAAEKRPYSAAFENRDHNENPAKKTQSAVLVKRLDLVNNDETIEGIVNIAKRQRIASVNFDLINTLGISLQLPDTATLQQQARKAGFSAYEIRQLENSANTLLAWNVVVSNHLINQGFPSEIALAACRLNKILPLASLCKLSSWQELKDKMALPDSLFGEGWDATPVDACGHFKLICQAYACGMTEDDIVRALDNSALFDTMDLIRNPQKLGISPEALSPEELAVVAMAVSTYEIPTSYFKDEVKTCAQWITARKMGFPAQIVIEHAQDKSLEKLIEAGQNLINLGFGEILKDVDLDPFMLCATFTKCPIKPSPELIMDACELEIPWDQICDWVELANRKIAGKDANVGAMEDTFWALFELDNYGFALCDLERLTKSYRDLLDVVQELWEIENPLLANRASVIVSGVNASEDIRFTIHHLHQLFSQLDAELNEMNFLEPHWHEEFLKLLPMLAKEATLQDTLLKLFAAGLGATVCQTAIEALGPDKWEKATQSILEELNELGLTAQDLIDRQIEDFKALQDFLSRAQKLLNWVDNQQSKWDMQRLTWSFKSDPSIQVSAVAFKDAAIEFLVKGSTAKVKDDRGGRFILDDASMTYISPIKLGWGGFGIVKKAISSQGSVVAAKIGKNTEKQAYMIAEFNTLNSIFASKQAIEGLQEPPLGSLSTPNFFAIVSNIFSHTLHDEVWGKDRERRPVACLMGDRSQPSIGKAFEKVLKHTGIGIKNLHDHGLAHLDIKMVNIGLKKDPIEGFSAFLIDLGSAQRKTLAKVPGESEEAFTRKYTLRSDHALSTSARDVEDEVSYGFSLEIRDVFGLGVTMYEMATQTLPYEQDTEGFPKVDTLGADEEQLQDVHASDRFIDIVDNMTKGDPCSRTQIPQLYKTVTTWNS